MKTHSAHPLIHLSLGNFGFEHLNRIIEGEHLLRKPAKHAKKTVVVLNSEDTQCITMLHAMEFDGVV